MKSNYKKFEKGDKIICINKNQLIISFASYVGLNELLDLYKIYTFDRYLKTKLKKNWK